MDAMTDIENSGPPDLQDIARELAASAQVPDASFDRFYESLACSIWEANLLSGTVGPTREAGGPMKWCDIIRAPDIKNPLEPMATAARELDAALGALLGASKSHGATLAGAMLEKALGDAAGAGEPTEFAPRLTAYRNWLATLIAAADTVGSLADEAFDAKRKPGRSIGTGKGPAFDNFVKRLDEITRQVGGETWTHSKGNYLDSNGDIVWNGTLLPAMELLRRCLPTSGFWPVAKVKGKDNVINLGYALEKLADRRKNWCKSEPVETQRPH
jgi:hypothetical protein